MRPPRKSLSEKLTPPRWTNGRGKRRLSAQALPDTASSCAWTMRAGNTDSGFRL